MLMRNVFVFVVVLAVVVSITEAASKTSPSFEKKVKQELSTPATGAKAPAEKKQLVSAKKLADLINADDPGLLAKPKPTKLDSKLIDAAYANGPQPSPTDKVAPTTDKTPDEALPPDTGDDETAPKFRQRMPGNALSPALLNLGEIIRMNNEANAAEEAEMLAAPDAGGGVPDCRDTPNPDAFIDRAKALASVGIYMVSYEGQIPGQPHMYSSHARQGETCYKMNNPIAAKLKDSGCGLYTKATATIKALSTCLLLTSYKGAAEDDENWQFLMGDTEPLLQKLAFAATVKPANQFVDFATERVKSMLGNDIFSALFDEAKFKVCLGAADLDKTPHGALQCFPVLHEGTGMIGHGLNVHSQDNQWHDWQNPARTCNVHPTCARMAVEELTHFSAAMYGKFSFFDLTSPSWKRCTTTGIKGNCRLWGRCWVKALRRVCAANKNCCPDDETHAACQKDVKSKKCKSLCKKK